MSLLRGFVALPGNCERLLWDHAISDTHVPKPRHPRVASASRQFRPANLRIEQSVVKVLSAHYTEMMESSVRRPHHLQARH